MHPFAASSWAALTSVLTLLGGTLGGEGEHPPRAPAPVDFAREVRPILSDRCFVCHGPDEGTRKARLRLDTLAGATAKRRASPPAVVPGDAAGSALVERIHADDPYDRMPPPESGKLLSAAEIALLTRWVEEGARWTEHWSFLPPVRPALPEVETSGPLDNPIDRFIVEVLRREGLEPAPEASPERLLRRASLDLTGLPPTLDALDEFLADDAPDAWERALDRLLASPSYGEQQARRWLDAARYGDTHGLHLDNERAIWRYRDWVIAAFNANQPFDSFAIEQLAGDLLPDATLEQRIATGFNRCNPTSAEGGMIAEEYLAKYAMDRVDTTAAVFLGLTMGCAQCHDHKFDPFSQREYYELFAYFNNVAEEASDGNGLAPPPIVVAPSPEDRRELERRRAELAELEQRLGEPMPAVDAAQEQWDLEQSRLAARRWSALEIRSARASGATLEVTAAGNLLASGALPAMDVYELEATTQLERVSAVQLLALRHESLPGGGPGRPSHNNFVLTDFELAVRHADGELEPVEIAAAAADYSQPKFDVALAIDGDPRSGWAVSSLAEDRVATFFLRAPLELAPGDALRLRLKHESPYTQHSIGHLRLSVSDAAELTQPALGAWYESGPFLAEDGASPHTTAFAPELASAGAVDLRAKDTSGAWSWRLRPDARDGSPVGFSGERRAMYLYREVFTARAAALDLALGSDDSLKVWLDGELVHDLDVPRGLTPGQDRLTLALEPGRHRLLFKIVNQGGAFAFTFERAAPNLAGLPLAVDRVLAAPRERRDEAQRTLLRDHFRASESEVWAALRDERDEAAAGLGRFESALPTTMVMAERMERRQAHVLKRGLYDQPGEPVSPGVPAVLPPLPADATPDRLGLARWIVARDNPLTARVVVNRLWQDHFGTGLVATSGDFGSQGGFPSHAELLDWLAVELVESGWDLKHMHRLMMTSRTYRQSARVRPELLAGDPDNRWLARGPRLRMDAEEIRDQALFASGLLVDRLGGPSVRPYQPPGVWEAVGYVGSNTQIFKRGSGQDLYRRSLYTFWKRTAPPPTMGLFDAPSRETCSVQRARTNTPLQALALLNDVQFVEAARFLGQRALLEGGDDDAARVTHAFRLVTARRPQPRELQVLLELLGDLRASYAADPQAAAELCAVGEAPFDERLEVLELAPWTVLASTILNLDEAVTRG